MDSMTLWTWSLVAGGVVVLIVAALLIGILVTARKIDQHAREVWQVGKEIAGNTVSIWLLERTNEVAKGILCTAQSIDSSLKALPAKLG